LGEEIDYGRESSGLLRFLDRIMNFEVKKEIFEACPSERRDPLFISVMSN